MHRRRKTLTGLAALLAVGFVLLNLLARNHARRMLFFSDAGTRTTSPEKLGAVQKLRVLATGVNLPRPVARRTPGDLGLAFTDQHIGGDTLPPLAAWHIPGNSGDVIALLFHGYGAERSSLLEEARALHETGCDVLMPDFRGGGQSPGDRTTLGMAEARDVALAVRHARARYPERRLILYGQSMGAVAILRATDAHDIAPDGIVLEAVFDTLLHTVRNRFRAMGVPAFPAAELLVLWGGIESGFNGFRHKPVTFARAVQCPVLMLHGELDPRARLAEARRVYREVGTSKRLVVFPGVQHEACIDHDPATWREAVAGLVAEVRRP